MTDEPLDPAIFDEDRFRNLIELGIADHPDPRIGRFLRAGAQFVTYPLEGERVRIMLEFTEAAPALAALRAEVSGQGQNRSKTRTATRGSTSSSRRSACSAGPRRADGSVDSVGRRLCEVAWLGVQPSQVKKSGGR